MTKLKSILRRGVQAKYFGAAADFLLVVGVYLIGQSTVLTVIKSVGITSSEQLYARPGILTAGYICGGLLTIASTYAVMRFRKMSFKDVLIKKPRFSDIGYGILGFGAYFLVVRIVLVVVEALVPAIDLNQAQNIGLKNISSGMMPLVFLALVVLPPLSEELLFRGFFLGRLLKYKISAPLTALIVSITFGAMHGQWNIGIDTFVLSMVMIYTLSIRKSLWVTVTMHVIKNTLAFLALFVFKIV